MTHITNRDAVTGRLTQPWSTTLHSGTDTESTAPTLPCSYSRLQIALSGMAPINESIARE